MGSTSTIKKLYDFSTQLDVPAEMRAWRVTEEDISRYLIAVSGDHASLKKVDAVAVGDTMKCSCVEGSEKYRSRTILLYPGRKLVGALSAEEAVVGLSEGTEFATELGGTLATLRINEIWRLTPMPVDDELAKAEGADTIQQLIERYIADYQPKKRLECQKKIAALIMRKLTSESEYDISTEEEIEWTTRRGKYIYNMMIANGEDPHIPDEGFTLLSDEEALAKLIEKNKPQFRRFVLERYIASLSGFHYTQEIFLREVDEFCDQHSEELKATGKTKDDLITDDSFSFSEESAYSERMRDYAMKAAEAFMEP
ncbi:MAG: hypothetical protein LIO49_02110 [Ruminococcus sp.]|nr:hypothetical protein [Ruminococcus sp.]